MIQSGEGFHFSLNLIKEGAMNKYYSEKYQNSLSDLAIRLERIRIERVIKEEGQMVLSYQSTHNGFLRCYYKDKRKNDWYCIQQCDPRGDYAIYSCTKDGEPCFQLPWSLFGIVDIELPKGDESTDKELKRFLIRRAYNE